MVNLIDFLKSSDMYDGELYIKNGVESKFGFCFGNESSFTDFAKTRYKDILFSEVVINKAGNIEIQNEDVDETLYDEFMGLCAGFINVKFYDRFVKEVE